ncbi:Uncharacterised protein [Mycobacteroides abscessus subsp. abscessus]|uniref:hypothetical protein n=1 Tax=Mycobacteroides abscessus TaxID=36809 RepID=UPI00092A46D9|nr:hypothetical protein [Mycobacteroides abscessus]SIC62474.1 Uncharacterised protein [Mycobacteroides abscessus subsp. abscessus]SIG63209.1 Uncharacterised protein [Mycobacteroides abscessus subsp. abscessus]
MTERETIDCITDATTGVWHVHTKRGTVHTWDMDASTVTRFPGDDAKPLPLDGIPLPIVLVTVPPMVGSPSAVALRLPDDPERAIVRASSRVSRIERVAR